MSRIVDKIQLLESGQVLLLDATDNILQTLPSSGVEVRPFRENTAQGGAQLRHDGKEFLVVAATLTRYQIEPAGEVEIDPAYTVQELCSLLSESFFVDSSALGGGSGLKSLIAVFKQTGVSIPTLEILYNSLGSSPSLTREGVGRYKLKVAAFPTKKPFTLGLNVNAPAALDAKTIMPIYYDAIHTWDLILSHEVGTNAINIDVNLAGTATAAEFSAIGLVNGLPLPQIFIPK